MHQVRSPSRAAWRRRCSRGLVFLKPGSTAAQMPAPARVQEKLLRVAPFAQQVDYFKGDPAQAVQRWAGAALVTILASTKVVLLSAGAVTFPFWWPWVQAANKNRALLAQYRCFPQALATACQCCSLNAAVRCLFRCWTLGVQLFRPSPLASPMTSFAVSTAASRCHIRSTSSTDTLVVA